MAFRLSASWVTELAPIMTEVTISSFSTHANAISARVCPRWAATSFSAFILLSTSFVSASFDQLFYECAVVFVTPCIFKSFQNLFMMNEFFCLG